MRVLSLFDGIACGRVAFDRAGILVDTYYASEIDPAAIKIAVKNNPTIIPIGDVNKIDFHDYVGKVDIIIGGSPCQDLSIAKQNREGLHGERSKLFWKYIEALEIIRPKYFLLENVASMRKEDMEAITHTLAKIYPVVYCNLINSALVSAQQRKRYYWTNWCVNQPQDKGIYLKDILEHDCTKSQVLTQRFGIKGLCYQDGKSKTLTATCHKGYGNDGTTLVAEPIRIGTLAGLGTGQANRIYSVQGKSVCLNALGGGGGAKTGLYKVDLPDGDYIIRKLTPIECERLQTLPDNYTQGVSDTQHYKQLGNGWTVDIIAHILKGLK